MPALTKVGDFMEGLIQGAWNRSKVNYSNDDLWWIAKNGPEPVANWALKELLEKQEKK
ncbi:MAG: hypothetical protein V1892_00540 [bacterium]